MTSTVLHIFFTHVLKMEIKAKIYIVMINSEINFISHFLCQIKILEYSKYQADQIIIKKYVKFKISKTPKHFFFPLVVMKSLFVTLKDTLYTFPLARNCILTGQKKKMLQIS